MIVEFNSPLETPLADLPTELVPPANHSHDVADRALQVIKKNSPTVIAGDGGGAANEDDEVMQIDNPAGVLSSEDHPPSHPN